MRKRDIVWEDPRFRKKKERPKALKINRFGEAPCELPAAHVPTYATPSIPSGMTAPPSPVTRAGESCARVCREAGTSRIGKPSGIARPQAPVVVATRPPSMAPQGGARPRQMIYRPGSGLSQRPCPSRAAPTSSAASVCPPRSSNICPRPSAATPCPPPPCPEPCPPPRPPSPTRRQASPPCPPQPSTARFSGLPRRSGLRPPMIRSGLRPPTATQATTIYARQRSPQPCPPEPCPPEPCPADPCPRRMSSSTPCPPQVSTPQPQQRSTAMRSGLRPPSRLMGPGSFSRFQPKPQKIVLLPGDINPHETTVITVEPPQPESYRSRSPQASSAWQNVMPSVPFDLSPPSMDSFRRQSACGIPPAPYIPPEVISMAEAQLEAKPCPEPETPQFETSSALLVDIEPFEPCAMEQRVVVEPVDLITFPAPDPFSPERVCRAPSPNVTPPPNPFTPPKDPIPEPSELDRWAAQYPRYKEAYTSSFHPIGEWAKLKFQQKRSGEAERQVQCVDRELVARSVPFNKTVSAICKDEDDDDFDDDLGLLHCMPDIEENFNAPLDYAVMRRLEEQKREEREARRRERERLERGPTLAETRDLLARIRQAESARRAQLASDVLSPCRPPPMTEEEMRSIHDRVMARHVGQQQQQQQQQQSDFSCLDMGAGGLLDDIELDDIDLDAIDECPDF